jgi:hypothetical protein
MCKAKKNQWWFINIANVSTFLWYLRDHYYYIIYWHQLFKLCPSSFLSKPRHYQWQNIFIRQFGFFWDIFFDATSKIKEFVIRLNPSYLIDIISPKFLREDRSVWVSLMESIWAQKILIQYHDNYSIWRCWSSNLIGLLLLQKSRELTNIN